MKKIIIMMAIMLTGCLTSPETESNKNDINDLFLTGKANGFIIEIDQLTGFKSFTIYINAGESIWAQPKFAIKENQIFLLSCNTQAKIDPYVNCRDIEYKIYINF